MYIIIKAGVWTKTGGTNISYQGWNAEEQEVIWFNIFKFYMVIVITRLFKLNESALEQEDTLSNYVRRPFLLVKSVCNFFANSDKNNWGSLRHKATLRDSVRNITQHCISRNTKLLQKLSG